MNWNLPLLVASLLSTLTGTGPQGAVELFVDKGDVFIRAGANMGLTIGSEVIILGDEIAETGEYRSVGRATVLEVWTTLARIRVDDRALQHGAPRYARLAVAGQEARLRPEPTEVHGSAFFDPLGFLLFGPTAGVEIASQQLSGILFARLLSLGVLANSMFPGENERFAVAYGVGARGRYFFHGGFAGPHVGVQAEYIRSRVENSYFLIATNAHYFVPQIEGGYRFAFGRLYLGGVATLGYALQLANSVEDLTGSGRESLFNIRNVSSVYGNVGLEIGLYF